MFTVYVIYNGEKDKIYIGHTADLTIRLLRHNNKLPNKRTSFTSRNKGNWEVIYKEEYSERSQAMKREKQLKSSQGRKFIKDKLQSQNH